MIIHDWYGKLMITNQMDHGVLASRFVGHWGNDEFAKPVPFEAMEYAVRLHDNGWIHYDENACVHPKTRRPRRLHESTPTEHMDFYEEGINKVTAKNPYSGLIVSMHLTGLYQRRYGLEAGMRDISKTPGYEEPLADFIKRMENEQRNLRTKLADSEEFGTVASEEWVWTNWKFMQVFDRLSLHFCFYSPENTNTIPQAPRDYEGTEVDLTLTSVDETTVAVSPYPFSEPEIHVTQLVRFIDNRDYDDDEDVRTTLKNTPKEELNYTLVAG